MCALTIGVLEYLPPIAPGLKRTDFMAVLQSRIEDATNRLLAEGCKDPPQSGR